MGRLWMGLDGMRRRHRGPRRKKPVTPRMLRWMKAHLRPWESLGASSAWCAVALAYFFLLRAS
eukprot:42775-Lingulodinium_polyedra.AAC.1